MFARTAIGSTLFIFLSSWSAAAQAQATITTVAGMNWILAGERNPRNIPLLRIASLAVTAGGDLLVADSESSVVVRVPRGGGPVSIVAGTGERGSTGDGGLATEARLDRPVAITADPAGNIYIADSGCRIRRVTPGGTISMFIADAPRQPYSSTCYQIRALAWHPSGAMAALEEWNHPIGSYAAYRSVSVSLLVPGQPAGPVASLIRSTAWAVLAAAPDGAIYIADNVERRILRAAPLVVMAGTSADGDTGDGGPAVAATFQVPAGLAVGPDGAIYVCDSGSRRVRRIRTDGIITGFAGGATDRQPSGWYSPAARVSCSGALAADPAGSVYVADDTSRRIWRIDANGSTTAVLGSNDPAGSALALTATLSFPADMTADAAGNLYLADVNAHRVFKITGATITTVAGNGRSGFSGDGGRATQASLNFPSGVAVDATGNVYIVDRSNHRVRRVSPQGTISTFAGGGSLPVPPAAAIPATHSSLLWPTRVATDSTGNVYITTQTGLLRVDTGGNIRVVDTPLTPGADTLFIDAADNLYYAVSSLGLVKRTAAGVESLLTAEFPAMASTCDLAVDLGGTLYLATGIANVVYRLRAPGALLEVVAGSPYSAGFRGDGGPAGEALLNNPQGLALDSAGDLYVTDTGNRRIRKIWFPGNAVE
jgi:sugar lactone lactonase YvrE